MRPIPRLAIGHHKSSIRGNEGRTVMFWPPASAGLRRAPEGPPRDSGGTRGGRARGATVAYREPRRQQRHGLDLAVRDGGWDPRAVPGGAEGNVPQPGPRGELARRELAGPAGRGRGPGHPARGEPGRVRPDEPAR